MSIGRFSTNLRLRRMACAAASLALIASPGAWAAQQAEYAKLTKVQGTVLVDSGAGFVRVLDDVALKLGDRVMVADGGGAFLQFSDDCGLPLAAPSMTTVTETTCTVATQGDGEDGTGTGGGGVAVVVGLGVLGAGGFIVFNALSEEGPVSP
ncbi:MAG: hypothetical protein ACRED5_16110 [Propylenella sp.]